MKIKPTRRDFEIWTKCVPAAGDLVFLKEPNADLVPSGALLIPAAKTKRNKTLWALNHRSWYGYAVDRATHCVWLKPKEIESLPADKLIALAQAQIAADVPTLIRATRLEGDILARAPRVGRYAWITSHTWKRLTKKQRVSVMSAWFDQNELIYQETVSLTAVSGAVRKRLSKYKLDKVLHSFRDSSGGNCFAVAAAFATGETQLLNEWMLWTPLKKYLSNAGYKQYRDEGMPRPQDILVFKAKGQPLHAAIYLGDGIWFEKPGQDFYEPYRLVRFKTWKKEWPKSELVIFRK